MPLLLERWKSPVKKQHVVSLWKNHPLLAVCLEEPRQTLPGGGSAAL